MKINLLLTAFTCILMTIPTLTHADEIETAKAHYCDCLSQDYKDDKENLCRTRTISAYPKVTLTFTGIDCTPKSKTTKNLGSTLDGSKPHHGIGGMNPSDKSRGSFGMGRGRKSAKKRQLVRNSRIIVLGKFSERLVRKRVNKVYSKLNTCFQKALGKQPNLKGSINVSFKIKRYGQVDGFKVLKSSFKKPRLHQCVARILKKVVFPQTKDKGSTLVKYSLIFK